MITRGGEDCGDGGRSVPLAMRMEGDERALRRRVGGPTLSILLDVVAQARSTRSWLFLLVIVISAVAAATAFVGQAVVPWAIYPAL